MFPLQEVVTGTMAQVVKVTVPVVDIKAVPEMLEDTTTMAPTGVTALETMIQLEDTLAEPRKMARDLVTMAQPGTIDVESVIPVLGTMAASGMMAGDTGIIDGKSTIMVVDTMGEVDSKAVPGLKDQSTGKTYQNSIMNEKAQFSQGTFERLGQKVVKYRAEGEVVFEDQLHLSVGVIDEPAERGVEAEEAIPILGRRQKRLQRRFVRAIMPKLSRVAPLYDLVGRKLASPSEHYRVQPSIQAAEFLYSQIFEDWLAYWEAPKPCEDLEVLD